MRNLPAPSAELGENMEEKRYKIMRDENNYFYAVEDPEGFYSTRDPVNFISQSDLEYIWSLQEEAARAKEKEVMLAELDEKTANIPFRRYTYLELLCAECNYRTVVCINQQNSDRPLPYLIHCAVPMLIIGIDVEKGKLYNGRVVKQETLYKRSYIVAPMKEGENYYER